MNRRKGYEKIIYLFGGIAGGCMLVIGGGNPVLASSVDSAISKLFSESLEALTGGKKRSMEEIWMDTAISAVTGAIFSKTFDFLSGKLFKRLSNIPALSRLSGAGSYANQFKRVISGLKNGSNKHFSIKTLRNGIYSGLSGSFLENIVDGIGFKNNFDNFIKGLIMKNKTTPNAFSITRPKIEPIPEIDLLPIKFQLEYSN